VKKFIGILLTLTTYLSTAQEIPTDKECCLMKINGKAVNLCQLTANIFSNYKARSGELIGGSKFYHTFQDSLNAFYNINRDSLEKVGFFDEDTIFTDGDKRRLTNSELAFWGTVLEVNVAGSDSLCMYYKTEYTIVVERMAGSYYDFKKGDTIYLRNTEGNEGCGSDLFYIDYSHFTPHEEGNTYFFSLYNWHYLYISYTNKINEGKYSDPFCSNLFFDFNINQKRKFYEYEDEIIALFKRYYGQ